MKDIFIHSRSNSSLSTSPQYSFVSMKLNRLNSNVTQVGKVQRETLISV